MTQPLPWSATTAADEYTDYMRDVRRMAPNTIKGATGAMKRFLRANPGDLTTHDFTAELFSSYATTAYAGLAEKTRNLQVGHLKRWLQWLAEENRLGDDKAPWRHLVTIKKPRAARRKAFIRNDGMLDALIAAGRDWHERDAYFIQASYWFCRRGGEMIAMRVGDIDFDPRPKASHGIFGFVDAKNRGDMEYLPIPAPFADPLKDWLRIYAELVGPERKLTDDDWLFPALKTGKAKSLKGARMPMVLVPDKQLPWDSAADIYRRAFRVAGITRAPGMLTHGTRRGGLDDLIRAAGEAGRADGIRLAKTMASHASEQTTEIYTERSRDADVLGAAFEDIYGGPETAAPIELPATVHSLADARKRHLRAV